MRFLGRFGLRFCGCLHPCLSAPRVSKETLAPVTRIWPRRKFACIEKLKEKSFLLARFLVAAARGFHGVAFRSFGDRHVPPGFVAGNSLVVGSFDDNY